MQATIYAKDRAGFTITGPYTPHKVTAPGNPCKWSVAGRRKGVSATVLCQAVSVYFPTKRDARAFIAKNFAKAVQ